METLTQQTIKTDDLTLMMRITKADSFALAQLYEKYQRKVYSVILRIVKSEEEACEIMQDVFMQIWEKAILFDPTRGTVPAWIMTLAHNKAINFLRSRRSKKTSLEINHDHEQFSTLVNEQTIDSSTPCDNHLQQEMRVQILSLLKRLPKDQAAALYMSYYEGYSQSEIAKILKVPLGTIKTRMRQGMIRLNQVLQLSEFKELSLN